MEKEFSEITSNIIEEGEIKNNLKLKKFLKIFFSTTVILFVIGVSFFLYLKSLNQAPESFPTNEPITIESGSNIRLITETLQQKNVVKSDALLYYTLVFFYDPTTIKASTYIFNQPFSTFEIAKQLTIGDFDTNLVRFTHYEGESVVKLAKRASEILPNFNYDTFVLNATPLEGELFPETYFIPENYSDKELIILMQKTFNEKTAPLEERIKTSQYSQNEILTLASILEREANTPESKKIVSGILQNRLTINMPLQVDATMEYILNKPLQELAPEDLNIESPYNTYLNVGLPPTPIGNPGTESIEAVLEPIESEYLFYITGEDGNFYYSKTYEEHLENIEKYLR